MSSLQRGWAREDSGAASAELQDKVSSSGTPSPGLSSGTRRVGLEMLLELPRLAPGNSPGCADISQVCLGCPERTPQSHPGRLGLPNCCHPVHHSSSTARYPQHQHTLALSAVGTGSSPGGICPSASDTASEASTPPAMSAHCLQNLGTTSTAPSAGKIPAPLGPRSPRQLWGQPRGSALCLAPQGCSGTDV